MQKDCLCYVPVLKNFRCIATGSMSFMDPIMVQVLEIISLIDHITLT